jgi:hypothetical protein
MKAVVGCALIALVAAPGSLCSQTSLPAGLGATGKAAIERVVDSARVEGLPIEPLYAKAAEGRLKQATDAQIVAAVRALAGRFRSLRAELGATLDAASMSAAATALSSGIPISAIRDLRDAAAGSQDAAADFAGALVTATDLVARRVSPESATAAVQSLLARRATPEQFARLRAGVEEVIAGGRSPDLAARRASEAIVKSLPPPPPTMTTIKPPLDGDGSADVQVSPIPSTTRNPR